MGKTVEYERQGQIGFITFNRPEVSNAVSDELVSDFLVAVETAQEDEQAGVLILTGKGKNFCAGADLKEVPNRSLDAMVSRNQLMGRVSAMLVESDKPVIAAVNGYALGAGCEFAMSCDIRIASENAKFGFPEAEVGGMVTNGGTQILPRLVGMGKAKRMIFTTEIIDAREAERWGLAEKVVPAEELDKAAIEMANKIAGNSTMAIGLLKSLVNHNMNVSLEEAIRNEIEGVASLYACGETQARMSAKYKRMKRAK